MRLLTATLIVFAIHFPSAQADTSLGVKVGTLGLGVEGSYELSPRWGLRAGLNRFDYSFDDELDGVTYDGDLELATLSLLADFRPRSGGFRITGGAVLNDNAVRAVADPAPTYEVGDNVYTLEETGELSAVAEFDSVAPYLGIGYDFGGDSRLRFSTDVGVLFQGEAGVAIRSTGGTLSDDPGLRSDLDAEEQSFQDDLTDYDLYPVLSLGVRYAFE